jgi:hypothetical protein
MNTRNDFGNLLNSVGLLGVAVEVGVDQGCFAEEILKYWKGRLYFMVDGWKRWEGYNDLCERDNALMDDIYQRVLNKFKNEKRAVPIRSFSVEAAMIFQPNFFDFVYIDADHTYKSVKADIAAWWPKAKSGAIFAGHDYKEGMGVIQAVDEFVKENNLDLNLTAEDYASWWVIKP